MIAALLAVALGAEPQKPISLLIHSVEGADVASGIAWSQVLAAEFRRYGIRVTTQSDLAALMSGQMQQQKLGCNDADCGLDKDILMTADAVVLTTIAMGDEALINLRLDKNISKVDRRISAEFATVSRSDIPGALKELVPGLVEKLRATFPDRVGAVPGQSPAAADPPKTKRCSTSGGEALAAIATWWLLRRRVKAACSL